MSQRLVQMEGVDLIKFGHSLADFLGVFAASSV